MMVKHLTESLLEHCPVWKWDEANQYLEPVRLIGSELPTDLGPLFVKVRLSTVEGREYVGYVATLASVWALAFVIGESTFLFNAGLPELAGDQLRRLFDCLGEEPFRVFPVAYHSEFHFPAQESLSGEFSVAYDLGD